LAPVSEIHTPAGDGFLDPEADKGNDYGQVVYASASRKRCIWIEPDPYPAIVEL
jgi:hypothetical protein